MRGHYRDGRGFGVGCERRGKTRQASGPGAGYTSRAAAAGMIEHFSHRFHDAIARIDAANALDPNTSPAGPHELVYARRMTEWLARLDPAASEALRLAVRCQHLRRWAIPRSDYPLTRPGYLQWRASLARFHAEEAGKILRDVGYDAATVARVQALVRKERLRSDPEAQTLEDVACLVFLEDEFSDFARRHDEQKVLGILAKTWGKMSERGRAAALGLNLAPADRALIEKALARPPATPPGQAGRPPEANDPS